MAVNQMALMITKAVRNVLFQNARSRQAVHTSSVYFDKWLQPESPLEVASADDGVECDGITS
jgi:hypothetical protein